MLTRFRCHLVHCICVQAEAAGTIFKFRPTFTTQAINYSGCAHYYSSAKAVQEMGYQPPIGLDEAINRSLNHFWELRNKSPRPQPDANKPAPITSSMLFIPSVLIALLAVLFASSFTRTFYALLMLVLLWAWSSYRSSVGAAARMFVENDRDKLVSRAGRNILVTGANRGLGFHTCLDLLSRGYASKSSGAILYVACRDVSKGREAVAEMTKKYPGCRVEVLELDLASFSSVRKLVAELKASNVSLHVLIHNAGAMIATSVTSDGHECQWQSNYLGSFLLTQLLLQQNVLAPAARIVNVSSVMHRMAEFFEGPALKGVPLTPSPSGHGVQRVAMYCRTKLAQIMWAAKQQRLFNQEADAARQSSFGKEPTNPLMNRRTIVSVNPGAVATDFITHFIPVWLAKAVEPLLMALVEKTPVQGVQGIVYAAVSSEMDNVGGVYCDNCQVCLPSQLARDERVQEELWNKSVQACEELMQ